jgi:HSP20 family molecular chaperone IbpA
MSLIRYETSPMTTLLDNLDSLFSDGFDWTGRELTGSLYPHVDITESDSGYKITADLPGLTREDIKVNIEDGVLSISGEKKREVEKREKDLYFHLERSYGKYANGVLDVHLRKTEEAKPKAIEVKVE